MVLHGWGSSICIVGGGRGSGGRYRLAMSPSLSRYIIWRQSNRSEAATGPGRADSDAGPGWADSDEDTSRMAKSPEMHVVDDALAPPILRRLLFSRFS